MTECAQRDAEGSRHDSAAIDDAEDSRGGDGAHADEAHVVAIDLSTAVICEMGRMAG